jgi:hypothetical protein
VQDVDKLIEEVASVDERGLSSVKSRTSQDVLVLRELDIARLLTFLHASSKSILTRDDRDREVTVGKAEPPSVGEIELLEVVQPQKVARQLQ